jgi:hypothetical protein
MAIRGCETLPKELETYRDTQWAQSNISHHMDSQNWIGNWVGHKGVERGAHCRDRQRGEEEMQGGSRAAHQRKSRHKHGRSPEHGGRRWGRIAGEGGNARDIEEKRRETEEVVSAPGSGRERFFKNRIWAHRTVYSACSVHTGQRTVAVRWTTGHRTGKRILSARLSVHRTLHSAVSGAHRTVRWAQTEGSWNFWIYLSNFQPNQIPTYNHTK